MEHPTPKTFTYSLKYYTSVPYWLPNTVTTEARSQEEADKRLEMSHPNFFVWYDREEDPTPDPAPRALFMIFMAPQPDGGHCSIMARYTGGELMTVTPTSWTRLTRLIYAKKARLVPVSTMSRWLSFELTR